MRSHSNILVAIVLSFVLLTPPLWAAEGQTGPIFRSAHHRALYRNLHSPFKGRWDRDRHIRVPLADSRNWRRVRFRLLDHLSGFKQKSGSLYSAVFVFKTTQKKPSSAQCLRAFEMQNQKRIRQFKIKHSPFKSLEGSWRGQALSARTADGYVRVFFSKHKFSAAWVAYPAYENGCAIYAFVSMWKKEGRLAQAARERWLSKTSKVKIRGTLVPSRSKKK